jgi:hypothetical protein
MSAHAAPNRLKARTGEKKKSTDSPSDGTAPLAKSHWLFREEMWKIVQPKGVVKDPTKLGLWEALKRAILANQCPTFVPLTDTDELLVYDGASAHKYLTECAKQWEKAHPGRTLRSYERSKPVDPNDECAKLIAAYADPEISHGMALYLLALTAHSMQKPVHMFLSTSHVLPAGVKCERRRREEANPGRPHEEVPAASAYYLGRGLCDAGHGD